MQRDTQQRLDFNGAKLDTVKFTYASRQSIHTVDRKKHYFLKYLMMWLYITAVDEICPVTFMDQPHSSLSINCVSFVCHFAAAFDFSKHLTHCDLVTPYGNIDPSESRAMACCLRAQSRYLNKCWVITNEVMWHSPKTNFRERAQDVN